VVLTEGLGPRRLERLQAILPDPLDWPSAGDETLRSAGLDDALIRTLRRPDPNAMQRCLRWLEADHHWLITRDDPLYPPLLQRIPDPPLALFVAGQPDVLVRPQIAIVGSRSATRGGLDHAGSFAHRLARAGFVITSGLAAGVDGAAHRGCLDAGGQTIAVAGTGPDRVYPARHRRLAEDILEGGALISSFPPGTPPLPGNFPARNRIISGASLGVVVIEAGLRSGSLITARLANEQGREVFAIPGSVHNPQARGCHRLIRDGAHLTESADEVIEALAPLAQELAGALEHLLELDGGRNDKGLDESPDLPHILSDPDYQQLLDVIGFDPTPVDTIIERSNLTPAAVSSMLLMLELDGAVVAHAGGRYSRNA